MIKNVYECHCFYIIIIIAFFTETCINNDNTKREFCWILILTHVTGIKPNAYLLVRISEMATSSASSEVYTVFLIYSWRISAGKRCVFEGIPSPHM